MTTVADRDTDLELLARIHSEYVEMPGLQLTLAQASRLWNVDAARTAQVLETLIDVSFLRRVGNRYVRADCGRMCA